jgi:hypothetical protein
MTIEEIKTKRTQLAADISEAVNTFQRETGCRVERVSLMHLVTDASDLPTKTQVTVEIVVD